MPRGSTIDLPCQLGHSAIARVSLNLWPDKHLSSRSCILGESVLLCKHQIKCGDSEEWQPISVGCRARVSGPTRWQSPNGFWIFCSSSSAKNRHCNIHAVVIWRGLVVMVISTALVNHILPSPRMLSSEQGIWNVCLDANEFWTWAKNRPKPDQLETTFMPSSSFGLVSTAFSHPQPFCHPQTLSSEQGIWTWTSVRTETETTRSNEELLLSLFVTMLGHSRPNRTSSFPDCVGLRFHDVHSIYWEKNCQTFE